MVDLESKRVLEAYSRRNSSVDKRRYSPFDPAHLMLHFSRQHAFLNMLKHCGIFSLEGLKVLEVGCGAGSILLEYLEYGAKPFDLFGIDLQPSELAQGHERSSNLHLINASGINIPFAASSFDIVSAYTLFSSILNNDVRSRLAAEMLRVVKSTGILAIYDFWPNNPWNADVRGVPLRELKNLTPGCCRDVQHVVLAPPIARRLAPISLLLCILLEKLKLFNTHYMVSIHPPLIMK